MRILIVIAVVDEALCRVVEGRQGLLIPASFRTKNHSTIGGAAFQIVAVHAAAGLSSDRLLDSIEERIASRPDGVIVLADRTLGLAVRPISDLYFMSEFDQNRQTPSPQNFLTAQLNKALRDFDHLLTRFRDAKYQKVLRLPIRNFVAPEIEQMRTTCVRTTDEVGFLRRLDALLQQFRQRQHPKRKSTYSKEYLVDDDDKYFEVGKEEHARAETGPPHTRLCQLAKCHRFGCGFPPDFHYNVSREGIMMTGNYPNCHGDDQSAENRTHLNMFTSDFF